MARRNSIKLVGVLVGVMLTLGLASCAGEDEEGVTTETTTEATTDSTSSSTGSVTLKSAPFTVGKAVSANLQTGKRDNYVSTDVSVDTAALTDFRFCITQIKMTEDTSADPTTDVSGDVPTGAIEAILGLIDVSDPTVATTWGTLDIPVGFMLSELAVEVHKDSENCSAAEYSVLYNGIQLSQDLEFKFDFSPSIQLDAGDVLNLALSNIAGTFQAANAAGALDDENITAYVEDLVEEGSEE
jgi:hypothetical protein